MIAAFPSSAILRAHAELPQNVGAPAGGAIGRGPRALDAWVREVVDWHFDPATGCPFWLDYATKLGWDPRSEITRFDDLKRSARSRTNGCAAARCSAGCRRGSPASRSTSSRPAARPASPRPASAVEDFRIDYEMFSDTLPDEYFPKGRNWLMLGPSGPRRLRLAVEHLASTAAASASASTSIRAGSSS